MNFCQPCGKLLSTGTVVQDPKDALAFTLQGYSLEPHILQPMKDGCLVSCVGCYIANGIAKLCPTTQAWQAVPLATLPTGAPETQDAWRARLAQRQGVPVDHPDLVAAFNRLGI